MLHEIITGLNEIHKQNLIHCDFHDGNILNHDDVMIKCYRTMDYKGDHRLKRFSRFMTFIIFTHNYLHL
jgi:RIO-like serine/threonine protein kinase